MSKIKSHLAAAGVILLLLLGAWGIIALGRTGAAIALGLIVVIAIGALYGGFYFAFREWRAKQ